MSSIKNSWTQGRSKESHPPALCSPSFLQNSPPWLPAPNGIKHFYCRVSCHFSSPGLGYRDSPSPAPGRPRRAPAERPGLARAEAHMWLFSLGQSWLLIGWGEHRAHQTAAGLTYRPNIPESSCNSNILIFYQWLANSNRHKIKLTLSCSVQPNSKYETILLLFACDAITPGLSPECEENCKFD